MTPAELNARLASLASGGLKGRHVYGTSGSVSPAVFPIGIDVRTVDGVVWLTGREWPRGAAERRKAVAAAFGEAMSTLAGDESGPLLIVVEHADPLIGELGSLTPLHELFVGDDRMLIFRCDAPLTGAALSDASPQLSFRPNAALQRLVAEFDLPIVEA